MISRTIKHLAMSEIFFNQVVKCKYVCIKHPVFLDKPASVRHGKVKGSMLCRSKHSI